MKYWIVSFSEDSEKYLETKKILDKKFEYSEDNFEYLFVVGGDGSFLHFFKKYAFSSKKLIGIKSGSISFLSSLFQVKSFKFDSKEWERIELLKIVGMETHYAINEIYISGDFLLDLEMEINGVFLQRFRGSGLLISTRTGSTAKNKSLGGSVVFPNSKVWLVSGIGAQSSNKFRSISNTIVISIKDKLKVSNLKSFRIYIDGHEVDFNSDSLEISMTKGSSMVLKSSMKEYVEKFRKVFL